MRKFISNHKLIALLGILVLVAAPVVLFVIINANSNSSSEQLDKPDVSPKFLLSSDTQISQSYTLLGTDSLAKTYQYNEVFDLVDGNAVVTKQNVIYYIQFDEKGEILREVELGIRPDLVLSMARRVIVNDTDTYFVIVIPLRGIRLFKIAADNQITEKYYPINEFFRVYSDNDIFINADTIYVPNGGLNLININTTTLTVENKQIDTTPCGAGSWSINHNLGSLFVLKSDTSICVYDLATAKSAKNFPLSGNLWFKLVPELNLLISEEWEMLNNFPSSLGKVSVYNLTENIETLTVDLSANADFIAERAASPGGYSLLGGSYVDGSLHLFTRAGLNTHALVFGLNDSSQFKQVLDFNYSKTTEINR